MSRIRRHRSTCACLAIGLAWAIGARGGAGSPADCSQITDDGARLACYDAVANEQSRKETAPASPAPVLAPVPPPAPVPAPAAPVAASQAAAPPQPSPEALFGLDTVQSEDAVRRAAGIERINEIHARVVSARIDPYRKLVLTLDNEQVWSQIDSPPLNLRTGDEVRIHRAAMGSYLLAGGDSKRTIRVRRSK